MKIDIHVHTKKTKAGDSVHRTIEVNRFINIVRGTDVKILAITNHNDFDYAQYISFRDGVADTCQIWPGIELDVVEEKGRAHLLVIVNPRNAQKFSERVAKLLEGKTPDSFTINLSETVKQFDDLDAIYIAHYDSKKPNLSNKDVDALAALISNPKKLLKEAVNSISAGIYINHGHNSIYGSDIHNWDDYIKLSQDLPELRLPVESFEQFCLLLEKDDTTIKTILEKKAPEVIQINPFGIAELMDLKIYNDINIIFGSKGTGKTEILKALSKYYNDKGFKTNVYASSATKLEDVYDLKGNSYTVDIAELGIESCEEELKFIRQATEKDITSLSTYIQYFSVEETNRVAKSLKIREFLQGDEKSPKRDLGAVKAIIQEIEEFEAYIDNNASLKEIVGDELFEALNEIIKKILAKVRVRVEEKLIDYKSIYLFNQIIKIFNREISRKTGQPEKPVNTGFAEYASNRIKIELCIEKILLNLSTKISPQIEYVGDLGAKGTLHCQTNLIIQNGKISHSSFKHLYSDTKIPEKKVAAQLETIFKYVYSTQLFEKIAELIAIEGGSEITSIKDLILYYRHFSLNDEAYTPSTGESSMVLLHNELKKEKEIYIIDEPERSLGNDYISEVIVPLIKERARMGKKIIIATHDANIAVRTLPYNSIYRSHDIRKYYTFLGNPFSNNLICTSTDKEPLDWKFISMKTLEGGKAAFGERGKIYGNV